MHELSQEVVLPWCLFDGECGEHIYIMDAEDSQVVRFHKSQSEIAKRVVASVNACKGISTEELLTSDFGEDSVEVGTLLGQAMQQRDELLEALQNLLVWDDGNLPGDLLDAARAAIDKATGNVLTDSDGGHCD